MACSSSCPTKDHSSWGECVRSKNIKTLYANSAGGLDLTTEKRFQKNLADYRAARKAGIQPESTNPRDVRQAVEMSEKAGKAFDAGTGTFK